MKAILCIGLVLFAAAVHAEPAERIVSKITAKKLYIYDAEGDELGALDRNKVKGVNGTVTIDGKTHEGIAVTTVDEEEGLAEVRLDGYPEPVWVETIAVELMPGYQLDCPEVTLAESEIEKTGMTIGFGDHCKQTEEEEAEE